MKLTIRESLSLAAAGKVDRENAVIHGVKLLGPVSSNGRTYSLPARQQAAKLYEGKKVRLDHPPRENPHSERRVLETVGVIKNARQEGDSVFGDLQLFKSHPNTAMILERAEQAPHTFGMSHDASGQTRQVKGETVVESLDVVRSVDLVEEPATNSGLFESKEPAPMKTKTVKQILETADAKAKKDWRYVRLMEMGEDMPLPMTAEVPVEEDMGSEAAINEAFKAAISAVLDDSSLSPEEQKNKIIQLIDAKVQIASGAEESPAEETPVEESKKQKPDPQLTKLQEQVEKLTAERDDALLTTSCRDLLESSDREINEPRLKALKRCGTDDERKELIESWPTRTELRKPPRSAPLRENAGGEYTPKNSKELAEELLRG